MRKITTTGFDLDGNRVDRVAATAFIGKYIPLGNLAGGPGIRCLMVLTLLHNLGYPLYYVVARYGERLRFVKRVLRIGG